LGADCLTRAVDIFDKVMLLIGLSSESEESDGSCQMLGVVTEKVAAVVVVCASTEGCLFGWFG